MTFLKKSKLLTELSVTPEIDPDADQISITQERNRTLTLMPQLLEVCDMTQAAVVAYATKQKFGSITK